MKEAEGTYKKETKYIWQIKHKSRQRYQDNVDSTMFDTGMAGMMNYIDSVDTEPLDTRIIKRTVKEDLLDKQNL